MPNNFDDAIQTGRNLLLQLAEAGTAPPASPRKVVSRLCLHSGIYPVPNLAVEACYSSFKQEAQKALDERKPIAVAKYFGKLAYCVALPKLSGASNIRDFIACVTYAMSIEIIPGTEGTRLLYAAQTAHTALTKRPKKRNKTSHTSTAIAARTKVE